ncbi:MAG: serine--tRNA ligase [Myxococcales bacterium]|nr:serine--tRNA ligase [Myxococcales bacterium]
MLDIRKIDQDPETFQERLARRGSDISFTEVVELSKRRRELIMRTEELRHQKSVTEASMKTADKKGPEFASFRDQMRALSQEIKTLAQSLKDTEERLKAELLQIPNIPDEDLPVGNSENDNRALRTHGEKPQFDYTPKEHWELGENLGYLDFERAVKVSQSRFSVLKGPLARLERALIQFMLDLHTEEHGYTEVLPPFLVNYDSMKGTGQFPKFKEDSFILERDNLALIPTAEVPVTNLHRDEILDGHDLPVRYTAYTPCFRREAGSYGRDTRGLIRQHQFQKVELVQFVRPETSDEALEQLTGHAETILKRLGLHFRTMLLCTGDLGFSAAKTYDLEVWLPGQQAYREISSCSNFREFQARRASIRYRPEPNSKPQLCHTLNGSGLAVGRTLVAILENYQNKDGSITVPEVLVSYMRGETVIK